MSANDEGRPFGVASLWSITRQTSIGRSNTSNTAAAATTQLKRDPLRLAFTATRGSAIPVGPAFRIASTFARKAGEATCNGPLSLTAFRKFSSRARIAAQFSHPVTCASTAARSSPCNSLSRKSVSRPRMSSHLFKPYYLFPIAIDFTVNAECQPESNVRSFPRARPSRDMTVPAGQCNTVAISW